MSDSLPTRLLGLDFSSAPSARKPLTLAWGTRAGGVVRLDRVDELPSHAALEALLAPAAASPSYASELTGGFVMGCDFPFGLPRAFVDALRQHGPGSLCEDLAQAPNGAHDEAGTLIRALHRHCGDRAGFQRLIDGWGQTWHTDRPTGPKLIHRPTDQAMPGKRKKNGKEEGKEKEKNKVRRK